MICWMSRCSKMKSPILLEEVLTNTEAFVFLPAETSTLMDKLWTEILSNDKNYSKWTIPAFLLVGILFSFDRHPMCGG